MQISTKKLKILFEQLFIIFIYYFIITKYKTISPLKYLPFQYQQFNSQILISSSTDSVGTSNTLRASHIQMNQ